MCVVIESLPTLKRVHQAPQHQRCCQQKNCHPKYLDVLLIEVSVVLLDEVYEHERNHKEHQSQQEEQNTENSSSWQDDIFIKLWVIFSASVSRAAPFSIVDH